MDGFKSDRLGTPNAGLGNFQQMEDDENRAETYDWGYSLFCFSMENKFRAFCFQLVGHSYFSDLIYTVIAFQSIIMALDEPALKDKYQKECMELISRVFLLIFVFECLFKIVAFGFCFGSRAYLRNNWNVLDFMIVMLSVVSEILEQYSTIDISFIRAFRALRILRAI